MGILAATWRLWIPILVLSISVGWLFKWRADYADNMLATYQTNLNIQARLKLENTKQEITENFRNGNHDVVAVSVVDGMLRAERIYPAEPKEGSSNRLLSPRRDTIHAYKLNQGVTVMGNQSGFTTEQIEFLKGNADLFKTGE